MATITISLSDWKKLNAEIARLKKRMERLEQLNKNLAVLVRHPKISTKTKKKVNNGNGHTLARKVTPIPNRDEKLWSLIGTVSLGYPTGADNERIDRDLAEEYASTHEAE